MQNTYNKRIKNKATTEFEKINVTPNSLEAEQAVLGGIMMDNLTWDTVESILIADDFYVQAHKIIFQEMQELYRIYKPLDIITIDQQLKNKGFIDIIGGFAYLAEISHNTPSVANIEAYARIIKDKSVLRNLITVSNEIAHNSYHPQGQEVDYILDDAERKILSIADKRLQDESAPKSAIDILDQTIKKIEERSKNASYITGIPTGFVDLDKKTTGLQNGDLVIVAARPSMGKTTFAMNICENAAFKANKPVLIFSLEMPAEQLMMRMLSSLCSIEQDKIRTGKLETDHEWAKISSIMGMLKQKPNIYIDDSSMLTPTEVRTKARRIHKEYANQGGLGMVMIDYLQLMRVPGFQENRHLEIAEISRSLKALAKELKIPVVALSQLNRSLEQRVDKKPINSDLRESGAIEQDADLILFLYRDWVYNKESDENLSEVIIGKQRNGPIGNIKLAFQGKFAKFDNYTDKYIEI